MAIKGSEEMSLVSVIIPNYNHAQYLSARIESVLNQTYSRYEIIILDDCSTDNSRDIVEKYRNHPKVKHIIFNEINSGSTFKQWQKGFNLARGEYIWIAESDDLASPEFLSSLIKAINGDRSITLAASGIILINEIGEATGYASISKSKKTRRYSGKEFIKENMLLGNHLLNASSAIFRRDVLKQVPLDFTSLKASGDYLFWIEVAHLGNVVEIPDRLDYFRRSLTTVTPRHYASGRAFEEAMIVFNRLKELGFTKGLYHNIITGFRLAQIRNSNGFKDENVRQHCLQIWKKESRNLFFDYLWYLFFGIKRKMERFIRNCI